MASGPRTVGFRMSLEQKPEIRRNGRGGGISNLGRQLLSYTGQRTKGITQLQKEDYDRMLRLKPLAALNTRVINSRHSLDMQRLGGGALVYTRHPDDGTKMANKIILAPGAIAPQGIGRPGKRPDKNSPELAAWKQHAVEYNGALSRQQMENPDNRVIGALKPIRVSTKDMAEIPVVKRYAARGGQELGTVTPVNALPRPAKPSTQIV